MRFFFAATLFVSASLLFCVEPILAKMLLPLLGGAPAVWSACVVFFQCALLAGYLYAHGATRFLGPRRHALVHGVLLIAALFVLPLGFAPDATARWPEDFALVFRILALLVATAGLPFFVVSANAPLLQRWFARAAPGADPYPLYGASNVGSMLALLAYPVAIEPFFGLRAQSRAWRAGYIVLALMVLACAVTAARAPSAKRSAALHRGPSAAPSAPLTWAQRGRWVALAAVPSSLFLGTTSYVTTDIAGIPLFWVVPLAIYLATFVLVFAERPRVPYALVVRALPFAVTLALGLLLAEVAQPVSVLVAVHLAMLFLACMVCHGELAKGRPDPSRLTEFYLWMSVGGVAGGFANALVAPAVLRGLAEYPLAMVLACLFRRAPDPALRASRRDLAFSGALFAATLALVLGTQALGVRGGPKAALVFGLPLLVNYSALARPFRFAAGLSAILLASTVWAGTLGSTLTQARNFFGVVRVTRDPTGRFHQIAHGNTIHGRQATDPARAREPLGYYHRTGPLGDVVAAFDADPPLPSVGVIGLGAGTMAAYAHPGVEWTFYEINPAVVRIAQDPRYFSYLSTAFPAREAYTVVLGDARLRLTGAKDGGFGLLVLDAFSSDAIPAHLLTREAVALYVRKLAPRSPRTPGWSPSAATISSCRKSSAPPENPSRSG